MLERELLQRRQVRREYGNKIEDSGERAVSTR